jgi:hypothetical protein
MSILIDENTRVLAQGLTGTQGRRDARFCLDYGTKIICGVTPGKGGEEVYGLPVYGTVAEAVAEHEIDASVIYAPPMRTKDAILEAIDAGVKLICALAEFVPRHDTVIVRAAAEKAGATPRKKQTRRDRRRRSGRGVRARPGRRLLAVGRHVGGTGPGYQTWRAWRVDQHLHGW